MRLGRIGFDHVAGYLEGGMEALATRPDLIRRTERVTAATLAELLASPEPPVVLDVRTEQEWQEQRIAGSLNLPVHQRPKRIHEVPCSRKLVVHCQTGDRSSIAVSLLAQHGPSRGGGGLKRRLNRWRRAFTFVREGGSVGILCARTIERAGQGCHTGMNDGSELGSDAGRHGH
jgi:rhodanese-related sulfurtransferase